MSQIAGLIEYILIPRKVDINLFKKRKVDINSVTTNLCLLNEIWNQSERKGYFLIERKKSIFNFKIETKACETFIT